MSKRILWLLGSFGCVLILLVGAFIIHAQQRPASVAGTGSQSQKPLYESENEFLPGVIPPSDQAYAAIDGNHLHEYVKDIAEISRRYRDQGHQLWGRISGTESDAETSRWILEKFRQAGLSNVHDQALDLPPQWLPDSWAVTAQGGGKTLHLETAQPTYGTSGTLPQGLDLEAVYVGLGTEADFAGRDVRGKAVFIYSMPEGGSGAFFRPFGVSVKDVEAKGAAAIFLVPAFPGNIRSGMYPQGSASAPLQEPFSLGKIPVFAVGLDDAQSVRELIEHAPASQPPRVTIHLSVKMVPNLKTTLDWAELPGTSDESIMIMAHRDGWFDGGSDDASGVATMVGLAEYFAKIPKEKRRRTITFVGVNGHHSAGGSVDSAWLAAHHDEVFKKTALLINCEHTAAALTFQAGSTIETTNGVDPLFWYAGGTPKLQHIAGQAFDEFGVLRITKPWEKAAGDAGAYDLQKWVPLVEAIDVGMFNHTDRETPDFVPSSGLAAVARAYAKIVTEVNKLDLKDAVGTSGAGDSGH